MVKMQFDKNIKIIRTNNDGEFVSLTMKEYYAKQGIMLETTCPYTAQ